MGIKRGKVSVFKAARLRNQFTGKQVFTQVVTKSKSQLVEDMWGPRSWDRTLLGSNPWKSRAYLRYKIPQGSSALLSKDYPLIERERKWSGEQVRKTSSNKANWPYPKGMGVQRRTPCCGILIPVQRYWIEYLIAEVCVTSHTKTDLFTCNMVTWIASQGLTVRDYK